MSETLRHLAHDELVPSAQNVRDELGDLSELEASIRESGLLQPLLVTPQGNLFRVVAGHRRLSAGLRAGLKSFPCVVRDLDEQQVLEAMIVENTHRRMLNPIEQGRALSRLAASGLSQAEIARRIGRSQTHVSNHLAILKLPIEEQRRIARGEIGVQTALAPRRRTYGPRGSTVTPPPSAQLSDKAVAPLPDGLDDVLYDLYDVCRRQGAVYDKAKSFAEQLVAGVPPRRAVQLVIRLLEGKPTPLEAVS